MTQSRNCLFCCVSFHVIIVQSFIVKLITNSMEKKKDLI